MSEALQKAIITASTWLVIAVLSFGCGALYDSKRHDQADAKNDAKLVEKQTETSKQVDKIITRYVTKKVEVPIYVHSPANTCTELDGNFRLFYDSAATGLPYTAGDTNAAPASVDIVATSIADNFKSCTENANQLTALQDWARTVSQP